MTVASTRERREAPLERARREFGELRTQEAALEAERRQIASGIAVDGKLSRERKSELARVNRDLRKLSPQLKRAQRAYDRESEKAQAQADRERKRQQAREERERDRRRARVAKLVERAEATSRRQACFARLPEGSRPTRCVASDDSRPMLTYGYVTKQGRGQSARFVLVVTDSLTMAVLPLDVSHPSAVRAGACLPPEALKAIEKAGAFRITRSGGIQPLKVTQQTGGAAVTVDDDPLTRQWPQRYHAEKVGTAYMLPDDPPAGAAKFVSDALGHVPKRPARANEYRVALNPSLLQQLALALGAGREVTLTFDLSKAGKASDGRKCSSVILVQNGTDAVGAIMPIRIGDKR